jgi:RNA polymerase sigma-70 factor (ECF subfamily)
MISEKKMQLSDENLIARVARGDRHALEILYDRHAARVLGFSLQIVSERAAAEELLQETFWQVWQRSVTFQAQHLSFTSWLFMIVRTLHRTANSHRKDTHRGKWKIIDDDSSVDPPPQAAPLQNALRSLPREQRQVIEMAYLHGMTRQEIANAMGETLDTISGLVQLGLRKLQEDLENDANI